MKRNCLVLIFLFMLLLTTGAFGYSGDVCVKFNPDVDGNSTFLWYNNENTVEIWIQNSDPIQGLSIGFEFTSTLPGMSWKSGYGNKPTGNLPLPPSPACTNKPTSKYIQEWGDVVGTLNNKLLFTYEVCLIPEWPYRFLLGGADADTPIPPHSTSMKAYSLKLLMPDDPDPLTPETFSVAPKFIPSAGAWKFVWDADNFTMPTFCGLSTGSNPADPQLVDGPIEVPIALRPCVGPVITGPGAQVLSSHSGFTFPFTKTDGEIPPSSWSPAPTVGTITTGGAYSLTPGFCPPTTTAVIVYASNACPTTTPYPFTITWTNALPIIDCALIGTPIATIGSTKVIPIPVTDADAGDAASLVWNAITDAPVGSYAFVGNDLHFTPPSTGIYHFTITATDMCNGVSAPCIFTIEAVAYDIVQIPKLGDGGAFVFQGTYTYVPVYLTGSALSLGGYNLLIQYDASALSFVSAKIGAPLGPCPNGSGWEYFTYRFGDDGNCGGPCPTGLLRIIALAETNNGTNHPGCNGTKDPYDAYGIIAELKFYVTNDRNFECQYTEIKFAWIDCGDNTFSDPTGNILYVAADKAVHTFEWDGLTLGEYGIPCENWPNMTGVIYGAFCTADQVDCELDPLKPISEKLYFWNGGIDIACANEIDARGDINLNGVANEVADVVLFTNYFIQGIAAFYDDPYSATRVQGKVAASDVNADGRPLTVGDLVYLLRIILGDAQPILKLSPFASGATVNVANGTVTTESANEIGAVLVTFAVNGAYSVSSKTNMQVESGEVSGELKVLVYSGMSNLSNRIASGTNELFTVSGDVELKSVEVADYAGNMLSTRLNKVSLPTSFALSQNVPNPFNPTTKLGFALPNQTDWTLNIYNVAGQLVKSFSGNGIGNVSVEWDASSASSGVYFYKLNAGSFSDTKKMVLMK
jgi:hypothetical protein